MGIIKNFLINILIQIRTLIKPFIKGLKLFSFLLLIIVCTFSVIRKRDKLSLNIEEGVKNNLPVSRNYIAINNSSIRKLSKADKSKFNSILNKKISNYKEINTLDHRYRINDTLFSVQVFFDRNNDIKAIDKPIKIH